jgi:hypothetical protein
MGGPMRKVRITIGALATAGALAWPLVGTASAADVADNQGFCKKQGPSACAGQSECSTAHDDALPAGQRKKC